MSSDLSITELRGIGPHRAELLNSLDINSILDILHHFPHRYEDRSEIKTIAEMTPDVLQTTLVEIVKFDENIRSRKLVITKAEVTDQHSTAKVVWFNQPFIKNVLRPGKKLILTGKMKHEYNKKEIQAVDYQIYEGDGEDYTGEILGVYPSTEGLNQKFWRGIIKQAINKSSGRLVDIFSSEIRKKYNLANISEAILGIHFPEDQQVLERARFRLVFEELFLLQMTLNILKREQYENLGITLPKEHPQNQVFLDNLPFELTTAQKRVYREICMDLEAPKPMHRLLQGDVGSGKTVIAAMALLKTVGNGYLGVLMAPTEILAGQHYSSLKAWFDPLSINVAILTGSMNKQEKIHIKEDMAAGKINIIIGTHALLQENIILSNAGLIIIDEQHRFGVRQRKILEEKGANPNVLVMTATPIPRTLALILYGDLDVSTLDELPAGRKTIETLCLKETAKHKVYDFCVRQLKTGAQIYCVCPLIEESEVLDIAAAEKTAAELEIRLQPYKVGLLHGKMSGKEKEVLMRSFACGDAKVLVSTTVIEVGMNVPDATVMIIYDADRFGISQLHQLRGRVGRSKQQSYCVLLTRSDDYKALKRLKTVTENHDGFILAEEDLRLRGPGDMLGLRQHGLPEFKLADLNRDASILIKTRELMKEIEKEEHFFEAAENLPMKRKIDEMAKGIIKY